MTPLYTVVLTFGVVHGSWSKAALNIILKIKSLSRDINTYRLTALTVVFRKILEKILKSGIEEIMLPLDMAQGGFRRGRLPLDLVFSLDTILKERIRKK